MFAPTLPVSLTFSPLVNEAGTGLFMFGLRLCLPQTCQSFSKETGSREKRVFWPPLRVLSLHCVNPAGLIKGACAVVTNQVVQMKPSLTMWSDQSAAVSRHHIIAVLGPNNDKASVYCHHHSLLVGLLFCPSLIFINCNLLVNHAYIVVLFFPLF